MFFLRTVELDSSLQGVAGAVGTAPAGIVVCAPLLWPSTNPAESWTAIYRLAYEQGLAAFAPSKFQRALEPCMN